MSIQIAELKKPTPADLSHLFGQYPSRKVYQNACIDTLMSMKQAAELAHQEDRFEGMCFDAFKFPQGVRCNSTRFVGSSFKGTCLRGVYLAASDFRRADLSGADFTEADLREANLTSANLKGVCLEGADLIGVKGLTLMEDSILGASSIEGAQLDVESLIMAGFKDEDFAILHQKGVVFFTRESNFFNSGEPKDLIFSSQQKERVQRGGEVPKENYTALQFDNGFKEYVAGLRLEWERRQADIALKEKRYQIVCTPPATLREKGENGGEIVPPHQTLARRARGDRPGKSGSEKVTIH